MRSRINYLLALLCLAVGLPVLHAGSWEDANAAFASGDYAQAAPLYEKLIERDGPAAARLFNLGNTYAKLNQPGPAVLSYERAALLAPRDADIRANLKLTRPANAATLQSPPPWWMAPLYWLSLNEWSWTTALGITLLTGSVLMHQWFCRSFSKDAAPAAVLWHAGGLPPLAPEGLALRGTGQETHRKPAAPRKTPASWLWKSGGEPHALPGAALTGAGVGLTLALLGGLALQQRRGETDLAILVTPEPLLRLSPFAASDPVDTSPPLPGQRVIPTARHADWVHLSVLGSTASGWVPDKDIALIIPADR